MVSARRTGQSSSARARSAKVTVSTAVACSRSETGKSASSAATNACAASANLRRPAVQPAVVLQPVRRAHGRARSSARHADVPAPVARAGRAGTRIEFEHSPGRGDLHRQPQRVRRLRRAHYPGRWQGIRRHRGQAPQNLQVKAVENRQRVQEVADEAGIFPAQHREELRRPRSSSCGSITCSRCPCSTLTRVNDRAVRAAASGREPRLVPRPYPMPASALTRRYVPTHDAG